MSGQPTIFQRFVLPGLAFKAVVIGGGYATGRELAEFFFPAGPEGGLMGLVLVALLWSAVCTVTFLFARATHSLDYRTFFRNLLGPFWRLFELAYLALLMLILAVFGAASGEIGLAVFGWPSWAGGLCLAVAILLVTAAGNESVEGLFRYAALFLYAVYGIFAVLAFTTFGDRIGEVLAADHPVGNWVGGGLTYAGYNVVGAVVVLPVVRHFTGNRDAIVAGLASGPLAALPAFLFFLAMIAFYPEIGDEALPSSYMLDRLDVPVFPIVFQLMIFIALLETSASCVNAINERIGGVLEARGRTLTPRLRLAVAATLLALAMVVATRFGLIALIANGYRTLAYVIIGVFVVPLFTLGLWKLRRLAGGGPAPASEGEETP